MIFNILWARAKIARFRPFSRAGTELVYFPLGFTNKSGFRKGFSSRCRYSLPHHLLRSKRCDPFCHCFAVSFETAELPQLHSGLSGFVLVQNPPGLAWCTSTATAQ